MAKKKPRRMDVAAQKRPGLDLSDLHEELAYSGYPILGIEDRPDGFFVVIDADKAKPGQAESLPSAVLNSDPPPNKTIWKERLLSACQKRISLQAAALEAPNGMYEDDIARAQEDIDEAKGKLSRWQAERERPRR